MLLKEFLLNEEGLVTTDWVFLAAYGISLSITMADYSINGVEGITDNITESLDFETIDGRYDTFGRGEGDSSVVIEWEDENASQ